MNTFKIKEAKRWVIKFGSSIITSTETGLDYAAIRSWCEQIKTLLAQGKEIVIVSSGAVAAGAYRLGWTAPPDSLHEKQAAASIGQMSLVFAFEQEFRRLKLRLSQVLLTHDDLNDRGRYLNARNTFNTLLKLNVVPLVNENDTVATEEIRFGDNDTISAMVANLIEANALLILTDELGLRKADPSLQANADVIDNIYLDDPLLDKVAGPSKTNVGRGGMVTKIKAARLAGGANTHTFIASGKVPRIIERIANGEKTGTHLQPSGEPVNARKQWLSSLTPAGALELDNGAAKALETSGRSLLAVGVRQAWGNFRRGDPVLCKDAQGRTIAIGLSNYSRDNLRRIVGMNSEKARLIVGTDFETEVIHRNNLALT